MFGIDFGLWDSSKRPYGPGSGLQVPAAAQAGHWSDPCEALMHNIGTAIRGGEGSSLGGGPGGVPPARGVPAGGPGTPRESGEVSDGYSYPNNLQGLSVRL